MASPFSKIILDTNVLELDHILKKYPESIIRLNEKEINYNSIPGNLDNHMLAFEAKISDVSRLFIYFYMYKDFCVEDYEFFASTYSDQGIVNKFIIDRCYRLASENKLVGAVIDDEGYSDIINDWNDILVSNQEFEINKSISFVAFKKLNVVMKNIDIKKYFNIYIFNRLIL